MGYSKELKNYVMKAILVLFLLVCLSSMAFGQKNKGKNKNTPDLSLKVDSLAQRLGETKQQNEKLLLENEALSTDNEKMKKDVSNLTIEINQLRRKLSDQESELNRIKEEIIAKEAAKRAETQTSIEFEATDLDFGNIKEGASVTKIYKVKNTGKRRLLIEKVEASCGCTVAEWPRYPVEPGQQAEIKVVFNSLGKRGTQDKAITVIANTEPARTVLRIRGNVTGE